MRLKTCQATRLFPKSFLGFFDVITGHDELDEIVFMSNDVDGIKIDANARKLLGKIRQFTGVVFD